MLLVTQAHAGGQLVAASSSADGTQLLAAGDCGVAAYTATQRHADGAALHRRWHQAVGGRVQYAGPLVADAYLLITSSGGPVPAHAAVVQVLPAGGGGSAPGRHHVCATVELACEEQHEQPPMWPAFSGLVPGSDGAFTLAAALCLGTVHLLRAQRGPGGTWRLDAAASHLPGLLSAEPGSVLVIHSLALGPASAHLGPAGRLQATLLYSSHHLGSGGLDGMRHVACLEAQPGGMTLLTTCWFLRNVCPTTSLVAALPGARTLVAAQTSLLLVEADAPQQKRQVPVRLREQPTCAVALSERAAVLGDGSGQLLLLDLQRVELAAIAAVPLAAAPSCLAYLPHPASSSMEPAGPEEGHAQQAAPAEPAAGLLLVGSSAGSTLLEVPAAALAGDAAAAAAAEKWHPAAGGEGLGASLAPVASCLLIPDPSGCGDARLLMCCGEAPFGRLALGRLAAGLAPLAVGSADLPGLVRLLSLRASPTAAHHRYLLLSLEEGAGAAGAWTTVLELGEEGLQGAALPGLRTDATTLAAGPLAAGCMLQVTPEGAHVFKPSTGDAPSSWQPPSAAAVTLAAQQGQHVALACGAGVHVLHCSSSTGRLREERQLSLPQQASALALFQLGGNSRGEGGEIWLAAGLWVSNDVLLQPLSGGEPACRLRLGDRQCRSLLICQLGSGSGGAGSSSTTGTSTEPTYLIVGTSTGEVLWWRLAVQHDAFGAATSVQLQECGGARAGLAPIALHLLPPDPAVAAAAAAYSSSGDSSIADSSASPCVLAVADQALLLQPDPVHPSRLVALRLHGGQGLSAACPVLTDDLPGSRLAYIHAGQLAIGRLQLEPRMHWDDLPLAGSAVASSAAFHAPSGCAAVACTEADGSSSLRLVDVAAMQELGRLPLAPGQSVTALAVLPLPCSSAMQAGGGAAASSPAAATQQLQQQQQWAGCAPFLVVGVAEEGRSDVMAEGQLPPAVAEAADGQPWWRQQPDLGQQPQQQGDDGEPDSTARVKGRLLFYQWQRQAAASGSGRSSMAPGVVLRGSCPLPAAVFSLAAVVPDAQPCDASSPAEGGATSPRSPRSSAPAAEGPQLPVLVAGCDDGSLRLFRHEHCSRGRVFVDDAGLEARHAVEQGLAAITAAVQPVQLVERGSSSAAALEPAAEAAAAPSAGTAAASGSAGGSLQQQQELWHQQVALQLLAKAPTCFEGIPASLSVQGCTLFALDLLSSLTTFRVQPLAAGQPPSLLPLADDLSGRHLTAAVALTETAVLAGTPSGSVLLLHRDPAAERSRQAAARRQFELAQEAGGAAAVRQRHYVPTLRDAVPLDAVAGHEVGGSVVAVAPGLLGVPLHRVDELVGGSSTGGGDGSGGGGTSTTTSSSTGSDGSGQPQQPAATVVCSDGTVATCRLLTPQSYAALQQLQRAALATSYVDAGDGAAAAKLRLFDSEAPEGSIDGSALSAAFASRSWHARLIKAAPTATVQQGRALLESFGLL